MGILYNRKGNFHAHSNWTAANNMLLAFNPIPTGTLLLEQPPTKNWKKRPQIIEVQKIEYLEV